MLTHADSCWQARETKKYHDAFKRKETYAVTSAD
jgi:hypothetical protein